MIGVVSWISIAVVLVVWLTRRSWDKSERRDTVIGSRLSSRRPDPENLP